MADDYIKGGEKDPEKVKKQIEELTRVYRNAGRRMQRRLQNAALSDFDNFRISEQLRQVKAIVRALNAEAREIAENGIPDAYRYGADLAQNALQRQGVDVDQVALGNQIHTGAVQAITDQMTEDLIAANASIEHTARRILRATQQALIDERRINDIIARGVIEGEARRETSARLEAALRKRLGEGQFIQINGRHYRPDYYAELLARTRTREAVTEGAINVGAEYDVDLYQVSVHSGACDICLQFQGKVYSLSGATEGFPELKRRPPFHPHCRHVLLPFVPDPGDEKELEALKRISSGGNITDFDDYEAAVEGATKTAGQGPKGTQVSRALEIKGQFKQKDAYERTKDAIDSIHGDGDLPKIPIRQGEFSGGTQGHYVANPDFTPKEIKLDQFAAHPELTMAHEIGHFLDHAGIKGKEPKKFGSASVGGHSALQPWRDAVTETQAYKQMKHWRDNGGTFKATGPDGSIQYYPIDQTHVSYLLNDTELFARSYAQYIAQKSGNEKMLDQVERMRQIPEGLDSWYPYQWQEDDFSPVFDAMEVSFRTLGWME